MPHQPGSPGLAHVAECDDAGSWAGGDGTIVTFDSTGFKRIDAGPGNFIDRNAAAVSEVGRVPGVIEWGKNVSAGRSAPPEVFATT